MKHGNFMQDMQIQIWGDLGFSVYAMPHVAVKRGDGKWDGTHFEWISGISHNKKGFRSSVKTYLGNRCGNL